MADEANIIWLVCPKCDVREWWSKRAAPEACPECGSARHAVDGLGQAVVLWTTHLDPTMTVAPVQKRKRGRPWPAVSPLAHRNAQIVAHYRESGSLRKTAEAYNLTRQRVSQIVAAREK